MAIDDVDMFRYQLHGLGKDSIFRMFENPSVILVLVLLLAGAFSATKNRNYRILITALLVVIIVGAIVAPMISNNI